MERAKAREMLKSSQEILANLYRDYETQQREKCNCCFVNELQYKSVIVHLIKSKVLHQIIDDVILQEYKGVKENENRLVEHKIANRSVRISYGKSNGHKF